jgi:ribosome-associated protein
MARAAEPNRDTSKTTDASAGPLSGALIALIMGCLDDAKAENVVSIDIKEKSSIGDYMVVASGRSDRHRRSVAR